MAYFHVWWYDTDEAFCDLCGVATPVRDHGKCVLCGNYRSCPSCETLVTENLHDVVLVRPALAVNVQLGDRICLICGYHKTCTNPQQHYRSNRAVRLRALSETRTVQLRVV
jgi:hypothetical protein